MLTDEEVELVRHALDLGAAAAEWEEAAVLFFAHLRDRGVRADDVVRDTFVDWGAVHIPFGKHQGVAFRDADPGYLQWLKRWLEEDEERATKFRDLREAVVAYLGPASHRRVAAQTTTPRGPTLRSRAS